MKKTIITTYALLVFGGALFSQDYMRIVDSMKGAKFSEITEEIERQWEGKFQGKHSGRKQYERWKYYHRTRLTPDGYLQNVTKKNWDAKYNSQTKSSGLKSASSFQGNWESLGINHFDHLAEGYSGGMGRVNCITEDPSNSNIIYAGTPGGGLWRSTDAGATWSPLTDDMPRLGVSGIAIDPSSPQGNRTIYILTGDGDHADTESLGVYKSVDNGNTWMSSGLGVEVGRSYKLLMHPTDYNTLYVASINGIYKTTDGGLTWSLSVPNDYPVGDLVVDIEFNTGDPSTMYATSYKGKFFISVDAGSTWNKIGGTVERWTYRTAVAVTPANPDYVYVLNGVATYSTNGDGELLHVGFGGVYRSTDGGYTFTLMSETPNIMGGGIDGLTGGGQGWYDIAIAVSPTNPDEVHVGGVNCWKSLDGGVTWENTAHWVVNEAPVGNYTHADIHALEFFGDRLYCGSDGGVYLSTNNAGDWQDLSSGLEITQFYRIGGNPNNPDKILGGAQDNGLMLMDGSNIMHQWFGADGMTSMFDPNNESTYYGCTQYGILRKTIDGGATVNIVGPTDPDDPERYLSGEWVSPLTMDPENSNTIWLGLDDLWKSTDGGDNWAKVRVPIGTSYGFDNIEIAESNKDFMYVSIYSYLYFSGTGGSTWMRYTNFSNLGRHLSCVEVHPEDEYTAWACVGNTISKTTDAGVTWTDITGNLPDVNINSVVCQKQSLNRIYVGTDDGVYYLDDNSTQWVEFGDGLVHVEVYDLEINYASGKIRAATFGRGVWESDIITDCLDELVLTEPQSGDKTYQAKNIISTSTIAANSDIKYYATERIWLKKGFSSTGNAKFHGKLVSECPTQPVSMKNSADALTGSYAGPMPGLIENVGNSSNEEKLLSNDALSFYPNPASSSITLKFKVTSEEPTNISIIDLLGGVKEVIVHDEFLAEGEYEINHSLDALSGGVYFIRFSNGTNIRTERLVVSE